MAKYKFQFETGNIYDGPIELKVRDFVAEVKGKVNSSLASIIEAHGGQLVPEPTNPKAKKRKAKPIKWNEAGEK